MKQGIFLLIVLIGVGLTTVYFQRSIVRAWPGNGIMGLHSVASSVVTADRSTLEKQSSPSAIPEEANTPNRTEAAESPEPTDTVSEYFPDFDDEDSNASSETYTVTKVIDGDTLEVNDQDKAVRIRLIGVNTPEELDPRKGLQCYSVEAAQAVKGILEGSQVTLEADASQSEKDAYGRLLRYVYSEDGTLINEWLLQNGYAKEYTFIKPYHYQADFRAAQAEAKAQKRGLWQDQTCQGKATIQNKNCKIKGNINADGRKVYHLPGSQFYSRTVINPAQGERWFCSEADAQQSGWSKSH